MVSCLTVEISEKKLRERILTELTSNGVLLRTVVDLIVERLEDESLSGE